MKGLLALKLSLSKVLLVLLFVHPRRHLPPRQLSTASVRPCVHRGVAVHACTACSASAECRIIVMLAPLETSCWRRPRRVDVATHTVAQRDAAGETEFEHIADNTHGV